MSIIDHNLPSGWDRADGGLTTNFGTHTPTTPSVGGIGINSVNKTSIFEEYSDSPVVECGEQTTITHRFNCDYATAMLYQFAYVRGTYLQSTQNLPGVGVPLLSRVLSTTARPNPKTNNLSWELTVVCEGVNFYPPPDEFDIEIVELNPALEKHPRYSALSFYQRNVIRNAVVSDIQDIQQQWVNIITTFSSSADQWQNQKGQALELLYKKQRGEDSFYLSAYKIVFSQYFSDPPPLNPGGYIEDPFSLIPSYYWITPISNDNIFKQYVAANANLYPPGYGNTVSNPPYGLSWLRFTDTTHRNRTWWKKTMTWVGAPLSIWDNELYNPALQALQQSSSLGSLVLN